MDGMGNGEAIVKWILSGDKSEDPNSQSALTFLCVQIRERIFGRLSIDFFGRLLQLERGGS